MKKFKKMEARKDSPYISVSGLSVCRETGRIAGIRNPERH
jgi:hypothetical protein